MALNDVTAVRTTGGLGRALPGEDHISGIVAFMTDGNLPSGFATDDRLKVVYNIEGAEDLGITKGSATSGELHYHISEFFRMNPKGVLYVGIENSAAVDYSTITDLQDFAQGKIRQFGILGTIAFDGATLTTIQAVLTALETNHVPAVALYQGDFDTETAAALDDLTALTNERIGAVVFGDAGGQGKTISDTISRVTTALGTCLGALSAAKVSESIGWVQKFNLAGGGELETVRLAYDQALIGTANSELDTLRGKGYIIPRHHVGISGTYVERASVANAFTSDFSTLEDVRTMDKAVRNVRANLLPQLNSPLFVDPDSGEISEDTIAFFKNLAETPLVEMERLGEVSGYEVEIDQTQDVLATGQLEITIKIVPVGKAEKIVQNIGFAVSVG